MSNNSLKLRIYSHLVYGTQFIKPGQIPEKRDVWSPYSIIPFWKPMKMAVLFDDVFQSEVTIIVLTTECMDMTFESTYEVATLVRIVEGHDATMWWVGLMWKCCYLRLLMLVRSFLGDDDYCAVSVVSFLYFIFYPSCAIWSSMYFHAFVTVWCCQLSMSELAVYWIQLWSIFEISVMKIFFSS